MKNKMGLRLLGMLAGGCILYVFLFCIVYFGMAREGFFLSAIDFKKIEAKWDMQEEDVQIALNKMLTYVKNWDENANPQFQMDINGEKVDFYTKREILHMQDVRSVMTGCTYVAIVQVILGGLSWYVLISKKRFVDIAYGYIYTMGVALILLVIVGIISIIDIQWLINAFHKLLFEGNTWVLNPAKSRVVWFFGKAVYGKMVVYLMAAAVAMIATLIGAICYIKRHYVIF